MKHRFNLVTTLIAVLIGNLTLSNSVFAHTQWDPTGIVKPRTNSDNGKTAPCGGFARTNKPVTLEAGSTIDVAFLSTIYHQGYFRIAFSAAKDEGFDNNILAANIKDISGERNRTYRITLPNIECDACTLQLIQSMLDRTPPTNYYSCADIKLIKNTKVEDKTPPKPVSQLLVMANDTQIELTWTNPKDADFSGVLITEGAVSSSILPSTTQDYKTGDFIGNNVVVYKGNTERLSLRDRIPGNTYYYSIYSFDASLNYSGATQATIKLAQKTENIAPTLNLRAEQNKKDGANIVTNAGLVIVQATISDFNPNDTHQITWQSSDISNQSKDNNQFIFDPSSLNAGNYSITAQVVDSGTPQLSVTKTINLTLTTPAPIKLGSVNWLVLALLGGIILLVRKRSIKPN